jgi:hypothetical protein
MEIIRTRRRGGAIPQGVTDHPLPTTRELATANANLVVAGAAIDRTIILGKEWNLGLSAAFSTNDGVHLAGGALRTIARATSRGAACGATGWAASRLIHQPFLLVELLFTCGKNEIVPAITAF